MKRKELIRYVSAHAKLYRDPKTGIAWVADGTTGLGHSAHPNIDASGSVAGMKKRGAWSQDAKTVRSHGFIYNISECVVSDRLDQIAQMHCQCGGNHGKADGDLDHFVRVEDALDAIDDSSCLTRADFVEGNKAAVQHLYSLAWDDALKLIRTHGSLKKAANYVAKRIEELGNAESKPKL